MCKYFSCIIDRNGQVYWLKNSNSHEDIIRINNLKDDKIEDRDFVRIEIIPKDGKRVTRNKKDWVLKVDEPGTLPKWYIKNKKQNEKLCWNEWKKSVKKQIAINTEKRIVKDTYVIAQGNSHVEAHDNSHIDAYDNSHIKAHDNSHIKAYDNSHIDAYDNSHIDAYDNSHVVAHDNSHIKAYDNSYIDAYDNSEVEAYDNSHVVAHDNSHIKAHDNSYIYFCSVSCIDAYDNSKVEVYGDSQVKAYDNSHVVAHDNSEVEAYDYSQVTANHNAKILLCDRTICFRLSGNVKLNSKTCVCIDMFSDKILLKEGAEVEFQKKD